MTTFDRPRDIEVDEAAVFDAVQAQMAAVARRLGPCPLPQHLQDAHGGHLDEAQTRSVLAHAAACPMCQVLVEVAMEGMADAPDEAERRRLDARIAAATTNAGTHGGPLPVGQAWRWGALVALSAAAIVALVVLPPGRWRIATPQPPGPPARPAARVILRPPTMLLAERLETGGMGLASLSWRGDALGIPRWPAFDAACRAFDRGEFTDAERRLVAVTTSTPALGDAWLLLGISRLLLGYPADAIAPLTRARDALDGAARDDASWHLAVALHGAGRDGEARVLLDAMCASRWARAAMACVALGELEGQ